MLILIFHRLFNQLHQQDLKSPIFEHLEYEFVNSSSHMESENFQGWLHEYLCNFLFFLPFSLPLSLSPSLPSLLSFLPLSFLVFLYIYIIRSVVQSCPTLCNPMNRSTPGLPVQHQLPEFTETHFHRVSDAIQPSHPLSAPFPPAPNPSQHQSLFQWVNSSHEVAKVLEFQL